MAHSVTPAQELLERFHTRGVESALRFLAARVPQRYTAVFKLDGTFVCCVFSMDKQAQPWDEAFRRFPLADSFCQFVMRDEFLRVEDSRHEPMLNGSPYQGKILSYHAMSLTQLDGAVVGTVAHFDVVARPLDDDEFNLLALAARLLPEYLDSWRPWREA